jgi:ATP-dependent helicase/DNAse subunit B
MPTPTPEILERETKDFLDDVRLFVEAEIVDRATTAIGLEVSFGRPLDGDHEPLARAEPVTIRLGHGVTFNIAGRIDRINEVGPATLEVLDCKSGGTGATTGRAPSRVDAPCSTPCTGWRLSNC